MMMKTTKYATKNVGVLDLDSPDFIQAYKEKLLETFRNLISVLEENKLRWWVGYGTAIGAIRHRGLIPWDDDIDIMMPRQDYEKLLQFRESLASTNSRIICTYDEKYHATFAKFYDTDSTIWEAPQFKYTTGVFVDIFPMDLLNANEVHTISRRYLAVCKIYKSNCTILNFETFFEYLRRKQLKTIIALLFYKTLRIFLLGGNKMFCKEQDLLNRRTSGERYVVLGSSIPEGFKCKDFKEDLWVPFENFSVRIPVGYDNILTAIYGDYMTPPPVEQRVPIHIFHYINLKEDLSLEEVKERVKSGERCVF